MSLALLGCSNANFDIENESGRVENLRIGILRCSGCKMKFLHITVSYYLFSVFFVVNSTMHEQCHAWTVFSVVNSIFYSEQYFLQWIVFSAIDSKIIENEQ